MKAVVLAAGEGSRMWPLAEHRPKHLLPAAGKPLISHILEAIKQNSIEQVFVVVGFRSDLIRNTLGNGDHYGLQLEYLVQPKWTGTASALKIAFDAVGREPFLAIYGDLWLTPSAIRNVIENSRDCPRVMGVVRVTNPYEYGLVEVDGGRLRRIVEKPATKTKPEGWINSGIYVLDSEVFEGIDKTRVSRRAEYELTTSLQHVLDAGHEIMGVAIAREDWIDVGRPWDLLEANERAFAKLTGEVKGTIEQGAVLKGQVWLGENSVVKSGSYIEGPAYIGREARIGPNARIRPFTCVEDRVVVGTSCEIKNSIIMAGTKIPHLSYVGDSVIGENCNLGAGTITANIRFDEGTLKLRIKGRKQDSGRKKMGAMIGDEVQTGINVSILPGIRIGSGSWVGPGTVVRKDLPSGQFLRAKETQIQKPLRKVKRVE